MVASIRVCPSGCGRWVVVCGCDEGQAAGVVLRIEMKPTTEVQAVFDREIATARAEEKNLETVAEIRREAVCQADVERPIQRGEASDDELIVVGSRSAAADLNVERTLSSL